jgi:hypothetical protein
MKDGLYSHSNTDFSEVDLSQPVDYTCINAIQSYNSDGKGNSGDLEWFGFINNGIGLQGPFMAHFNPLLDILKTLRASRFGRDEDSAAGRTPSPQNLLMISEIK